VKVRTYLFLSLCSSLKVSASERLHIKLVKVTWRDLPLHYTPSLYTDKTSYVRVRSEACKLCFRVCVSVSK
jgi:hypothetical protein